jgi:hypothetical protein
MRPSQIAPKLPFGPAARAALALLAGLGGLAASTPSARADIIMFDMHLSNSEVQAVRAAAKKRSEEVIVLPHVAEELRERRAALVSALKSGRERDWSKLSKLMAQIPQKIDAQALLRETLKDLVARHRTVSAITASGESAGYAFDGDVGRVLNYDIASVMLEFPELLPGFRALYLMGCHSLDRVPLVWWHEKLPSLKVILGFAGTAPLADDPNSSHLLQSALEREDDLLKASTPEQAAKLFYGLREVRETNAAALVGETVVSVHGGVSSITVPPSCQGVEPRLRSLIPQYYQCLRADPGCIDVPTDPHHSRLRDFYEATQKYQYCASTVSYVASMPPKDQLVELLYFRNVRRHFATYFAREIERANAGLENAGASIRVPDLASPKLTRHDVLRAIADLGAAARTLGTQVPELGPLVQRADQLLGKLECVPLSWATEGEDSTRAPDAPACPAR